MTFTTVPNIPQNGEITDWEARFLGALKTNVELLTGQRGSEFAAVLTGEMIVTPVPNLLLQQITATGAGVSIAGDEVPLLEDYVKLLNDFANLAGDVAVIRSKLNSLIASLTD